MHTGLQENENGHKRKIEGFIPHYSLIIWGSQLYCPSVHLVIIPWVKLEDGMEVIQNLPYTPQKHSMRFTGTQAYDNWNNVF